jgi:hypothetical protein
MKNFVNSITCLKPPKPWVNWSLHFVCTLACGIFLVPFFRTHPIWLHEFAFEMANWQRILLVVFSCVLTAHFAFKLLSPRISHLKHFGNHPPAWSAWMLSLLALCIGDLTIGLSPETYNASSYEWIAYGLGTIFSVGLIRHFTTSCEALRRKSAPTELDQNWENWNWEDIEIWLESDATTEYDIIGNLSVAQRLKDLLLQGVRSIGIVGPFGSGKSCIVKWLVDLENSDKNATTLLFSEHSCWGFESSASSIEEMLTDAIKKVERKVDTFGVNSLPESYRQTFSAGNSWLDSISSLLFAKSNPIEQFQQLSEILVNMNLRLVFIVEDLDRNDSSSFDGEEVLAFLQQIKEHQNISFVLTGGLSSTKNIDFAKLCDHIEHLKPLQELSVSKLIQRVRAHCLDESIFPHTNLSDLQQGNPWHPYHGLMMRGMVEHSQLQATALLLKTPRNLRLALARTYLTWSSLPGEIDWDHLFALNALRFSASECYQFLLRRWDRLHSNPPDDPSNQQRRSAYLRNSLIKDWERTIEKVEWSPSAALTLMKFILPSSETWLVPNAETPYFSSPPSQGVQIDKYWYRALNEACDSADVRDQTVVKDTLQWLKDPSIDSELVAGICTIKGYANVLEQLESRFFTAKPDKILQISEQVLTRIGKEHGAEAGYDSLGYDQVKRFVKNRVSPSKENRVWLESRLEEASKVGVAFVKDIWNDYATLHIIEKEDVEAVRRYVIQVMRERIVNGVILDELLSSNIQYALYQLVFDPGDGEKYFVGLEPWSWLAPIILEGLRHKSIPVALNLASLVAARSDSHTWESPWGADLDLLHRLFPNDAAEVIQLLEDLSHEIRDTDQKK